MAGVAVAKAQHPGRAAQATTVELVAREALERAATVVPRIRWLLLTTVAHHRLPLGSITCRNPVRAARGEIRAVAMVQPHPQTPDTLAHQEF
jgi:hypothetical protein